jgi:tetratricopeptide (TPR) repeat protein
MNRIAVAFPAGLLLLSFTISSSAQNFTDSAGLPPSLPSALPSSVASSVSSIPRVPMQQATPQLPPAEDPSVITVRPELSGEQMADLYMVRKEYREAAQILKRLSDASPQNAIYLNKLGIAMHQQAALALALRYYERAAKVNPQYADAENNIGTVWYQRKRYTKAIRAYQRAIHIRPDMPVLYSNLAYAYFEDKKYEESLASFRQALALDPKFFEQGASRLGSVLQDRSIDDRGRFYFMLAKSFAQAGNLERCVIYLRKAKDEGYKALAAAKSDPVFAAYLNVLEVQEALAPKPSDLTRTAEPPRHKEGIQDW